MEKEKVIELASNNGIDEMERQVLSMGYHISSSVLAVVILLLMWLRFIKGNYFSQDLLLLLAAQVSSLSLYQYIKLKKTAYLFTFLIGMGAMVLTLINVLTEYGYIL